MAQTVGIKINGKYMESKKGTTIHEAAAQAQIFIPRLCGNPDLPPVGKCGICLVNIKGRGSLLSCSTTVRDGWEIETLEKDIKQKAYQSFMKIMNQIVKPVSPEIEEVYSYFWGKPIAKGKKIAQTKALVFNSAICVGCDSCYRVCTDNQKIAALDLKSHTMKKANCISCGQCVSVCPTGALIEAHSVPKVLRAFSAGKTVVLQVAPALRVSLAECFGSPVGTICTGKIVAAAHEIGFKYVFDTNFGADMTIIEEGTELISRLTSPAKGALPLFTSCCPAWVTFVEKFYPLLIPNLSTAKSPHEMLGKAIKTYFAKKNSIDPENLYTVSLMPCIAKKDEIERQQHQGVVDAVLTAREFADLIKTYELSWKDLADEKFDPVLGESSGSAALFGVTGGVAEAAIRFAHEKITGGKLGDVKYTQWRGFNAIKSAKITIKERVLRVAVCNGIAAARELIETGKYKEFTLIEVMACPYGCIGGGGQPYLKRGSDTKNRAASIYNVEKGSTKPTANDNTEVQKMYTEHFGKPYEGTAKEELHTTYGLTQE